MRTLNGRLTRSLGGALAATLLLGSLAACGDDNTDNTSSGTSPTVAGTPSDSGTGGGEVVDTASFAQQLTDSFGSLTSAHVSMKLDVGTQTITAAGDVDYSNDSPAMALTMNMPTSANGAMRLLLVDKAMYISVPGAGKKGTFYKIDLNDPNSPFGGSLGELSTFDPKKTFDLLSSGLKKVVKVGEEQVGDDATTHYLITIDTSAMAKSLPRASQGSLPKTMDYDLWLDADNRMRKMTADLPGAGQMAMELTGWGEPVHITAPPAGKVTRLPSRS